MKLAARSPVSGCWPSCSKCWPSAILDLLCVCLYHQRSEFGGIYHCAKFRWNRCSSFDNMQVLIPNAFGYSYHKCRFLEGLYPLYGKQSYCDPQKAPFCVEARHSHRSLRAVHLCWHSSLFTKLSELTLEFFHLCRHFVITSRGIKNCNL